MWLDVLHNMIKSNYFILRASYYILELHDDLFTFFLLLYY